MDEKTGGVFEYVEALLYDYPFLKARLDDVAYYAGDIIIPAAAKSGPSMPEKHVLKHAEALRIVTAIEKALRAMPRIQRRLVRLKYFEKWPNYVVAKRLHISEATFYRLREDAVKNIGLALGVESLEPQGFPGEG